MPSALVILTEELPLQPRELGPALAGSLGMVAYDVIGAFKRSPVLPFEDLQDDRAAAALNILKDRGVPATVVASDRLPPSPQVYKVHNADVEEQGLNVQVDVIGQMRIIEWDRIDLLSAATFNTEKSTTRTHRPTGLAREVYTTGGGGHAGMRFRRIRMPRTHKRVEHSEVIALWPRGMPGEIHFQSNALNFDYLGERLGASQVGNMRNFAADIRERVEGALISPGFEALVAEDRSPPKMSPHIFAQYNRWLMLRAQEGI
jgi:hypothetical protein